MKRYNEEEDTYSTMTVEAVSKLWNDDKYSKKGLENIALLLLDWINKK